MFDKSYPITVRFRSEGDTPDLAELMRQTETIRFWHELHRLYASTLGEFSESFDELVLHDVRSHLEAKLQNLLQGVVIIDGVKLIETDYLDEERDTRLVSLGLEAVDNDTSARVQFDNNGKMYIEAVTLDGSYIQLSKWADVYVQLDGREVKFGAEVVILVNLDEKGFFGQKDWYRREHAGDLTFRNTFDEEAIEEAELERIGNSLAQK